MPKSQGKKGESRMLVIKDLPVELRKNRGQKNLYLRVQPHDGRVTLSAPTYVSDREIEDFILKNHAKILATRKRILNLPYRNSPNYKHGDVIYLWGEPYRLELRLTDKSVRHHETDRTHRRVVITVREDATPEDRETIIDGWYRQELTRRLPEHVRKVEERTGLLALEYRVRKMKSRWGTCNIKARRIWVNLELTRYPRCCLDYILTHELVHLLEPNHSERFYALVEQYCPGWREAEAILQGR